MGLWDFLTGSKRARPGVTAVSSTAMRERLMAINRTTAPFKVRSGAPEGVDLVAEWKIVDAKWYSIFAKAGISRVFKILMSLDEGRHEVRAQDISLEVEWEAGAPNFVPTVRTSGKAFSGVTWEKSFEKVWAFREDLSYGEVYDYSFSTDEIKKPLMAAVVESGRAWKGVAFGKP